MEKKISRKALLWTSIVSVVLCIALLAGIVVLTLNGNGSANDVSRVTPASLGLQLLQHNGTDYVDVSNSIGDVFTGSSDAQAWKAGQTEIAFFQIKNTGSADVTVYLAQVVRLADNGNEPAGLHYAVLPGLTYEQNAAAPLDTWKAIFKAAGEVGSVAIGSTLLASDITIKAGESYSVAMAVSLDEKATADYQGAVIDVALAGRRTLEAPVITNEQEVFYVSPTGHDGNPGTEEEPLKTFHRAAQLAKPGQTYIFEDGEYNEGRTTTIMNSGTEDAPIIFKSRNVHGAKIIYAEGLCGVDKLQIFNKEYITIEGFDITQKKMADDSHPNAKLDVMVRCHSSNNITFRNNAIHGALEEPLKVYSANGILIEGNTIYDSGFEGIDFVNVSDAIVRGNEIYEVGRMALMCKGGSRSILFYNNYIHTKERTMENAVAAGGATDNKSTWGCTKEHWEAFNVYMFNNVILAEKPGAIQNGMTFMSAKDSGAFNNVIIGAQTGVFYRNSDGRALQWDWSPSNDDNFFMNNIVMNSTQNAVVMQDVNNNNVSDYNLWFGNAGETPKEANSIYDKDPMFVADKSDWHFKDGSPAIGKGSAIGELKGYSGQSFFVGFDVDYNLRGSTWDIGIYALDSGETYKPGELTYQDPSFRYEIDYTIFEAPVVGTMPEQGTQLAAESFNEITTLDKWVMYAGSEDKWTVKDQMLGMNVKEVEGRVSIGIAGGEGWSDYEFTAKVTAPSAENGTSSGIIFRADTALQNMYGFRFFPDSTADQMEFCMWNGDKFSSIQNIFFNWEPNRVYELKVICVANEFEFYVDGAKIATAIDDTYPCGTAALYCYEEPRTFDDILVRSAKGYKIEQMEDQDSVPKYTGKVLLEEDFSDPAVLDNWKQYTGEWRIENGVLTGTTGIKGENIIVYEKGYDWVNYEFSADVRQPEKGGMWAGLMFRCNDDKTAYYGFRFVNDNLEVAKGWPENWDAIGIKAMSGLPKGEVASLKVIVVGDTFRLYINGKKVWEDKDSFYANGTIGLFQQNMTEIVFDNLLVREIAVEGEEPGQSGGQTPEGTAVLEESFDSALTAPKWSNPKPDDGTYQFTDGGLHYTQVHKSNGGRILYSDGYWKNFTVTFDLTLPNAGNDNSWFRLLLRTKTGSEGCFVYFQNLGSELIRINDKSGSMKDVDGAPISALFNGESHPVMVSVKDNTIEVYIDNNLVSSVTNDRVLTDPGTIGFMTFNDDYVVDNLKVYCEDDPILEKPAEENPQ